MSSKVRLFILLTLLAMAMVVIDLVFIALLSRQTPPLAQPQPERITIYLDGQLVAEADLTTIASSEIVSFQDAERGERFKGLWVDALLLRYVAEDKLAPETTIIFVGRAPGSGNTREVKLTWAEISDHENRVLLGTSRAEGAPTLVGALERLDTREEWVQDVSRIDILTRP
ncbi:MAG: hypothetical protein H5T69_02860 [Chloroflexi bacterium]|nr:hypothetical protein [Chloroflexota bacterium]